MYASCMVFSACNSEGLYRMKKLPKFIVFILVALMSFSSFTACGDFGKSGGASSGADSGAVTETPEEILGSLNMHFIDD